MLSQLIKQDFCIIKCNACLFKINLITPVCTISKNSNFIGIKFSKPTINSKRLPI